MIACSQPVLEQFAQGFVGRCKACQFAQCAIPLSGQHLRAPEQTDELGRVEENIFTLSSELPPLEGHRPFRNIDRPFAETIAAGANAFVGMTPER